MLQRRIKKGGFLMVKKIKQYFKNRKFQKFIRNNSEYITLLSEDNWKISRKYIRKEDEVVLQ